MPFVVSKNKPDVFIDGMQNVLYCSSMKLEKLANKKFKLITVRSLIVTPDNQFLLLKRAPYKKKNALKWDLPGGGVDAGETPYNAILRETAEEVGCVFNHMDAVAKSKFSKKIRILFTAVAREPFNPVLDREHTEHMWIKNLSDLPDEMHPKTQELIGNRIPS